MKVNDAALQHLLGTYGPKGKSVGGPQPSKDSQRPASPKDEVSLSSEGQELQRMIRAANQADDVRAERVEEIRRQMQSGNYVLDPHKIANRMLGSGAGE